MEELDQLIKNNLEFLRAMAVKLRQKGMANQDVAELLNVTESFVSTWNTKYEKEGISILKPAYKGSKSYVPENEKKEILFYLKKQENITVYELIDYIKRTYNIEYKSLESYYTLLKEGGMSWHRTAPANPKKDEAKIEAVRAEIKKKWTNIKKK
jgi:transposase